MIQLRRALRLGDSPQIAFVGAGGKSSAMFALARQFDKPVLISTSTHFSVDQVILGDRQFEFEEAENIKDLDPSELPAVTIIIGPEQTKERVSGPGAENLCALSEFAHRYSLPLLIEADGARLRALKAPADHEPAIPDFVDAVVVVAGLSAFGKPLADERVHRAELFANLSGLEIGDEVTASALTAVLLSENGGLKNIPKEALRIAFLNQADSLELEAIARRISRDLLTGFDAVWVGALQKSPHLSAVYEPAAGILLAAGESKRLGRTKALLDWKGKPFIRQVAETALASGLNSLIVVTGADAANVEAAISDLTVKIARNGNWQKGQSSSVKAGLAALSPRVGAILFLVVDQPQLSVSLIDALVSEHANNLAPIVAPLVDDHRTNPVLFDRSTFGDFTSLSGDVGGRAIFSRYPVDWLPWLDSSLAIDVDTSEDYQNLLKQAR